MAERKKGDNSKFDEMSIDEKSVVDERLDEYDIREIEINTNGPQRPTIGVREANCDSKGCVLSEIGKLALYLCYVCNVYVCGECLRGHNKMHEFVRVKSAKKERKRKAYMLVESMRNERTRESHINVEDTKVYGRVNVKHELDKNDCVIYGLCGLQDKKWVVLDSRNYCMKIFSSVNNILLRYVRFGSVPRDATEIKRKSTDPNSASGSKSCVSVAADDEKDKHCLLAVIFRWLRQIWFLDLTKIPAVKIKTIEMKKRCYSIESSEDKIFTLCKEDVGYGSIRYSVDILSTDGKPLKVIQTDIDIADIALYKDKLYMTDFYNTVLCKNSEDGQKISQHYIEERSGLRGICVDPSSNAFVCGNNKVYKLSPDLCGYEPLNLDSDYTLRPEKMCFTDGKLFCSHNRRSSVQNYVTVVQLT